MCIGIPQKVIEIKGKKAIVSQGDHKHEVDISLISDNLSRGDYLLSAKGMAISKLPENEAKKILRFVKEER